MDDATKQALAELKATADRFSATVNRCIEQEQADLAEITQLAGEVRSQAWQAYVALNAPGTRTEPRDEHVAPWAEYLQREGERYLHSDGMFEYTGDIVDGLPRGI